ncbi:hypothetical protein HDU96_000566 [Phlyctochytrium bullatum]|nr:hypothetical protein HDU96_000566 [Phlyctochytrium bullatum]
MASQQQQQPLPITSSSSSSVASVIASRPTSSATASAAAAVAPQDPAPIPTSPLAPQVVGALIGSTALLAGIVIGLILHLRRTHRRKSMAISAPQLPPQQQQQRELEIDDGPAVSMFSPPASQTLRSEVYGMEKYAGYASPVPPVPSTGLRSGTPQQQVGMTSTASGSTTAYQYSSASGAAPYNQRGAQQQQSYNDPYAYNTPQQPQQQPWRAVSPPQQQQRYTPSHTPQPIAIDVSPREMPPMNMGARTERSASTGSAVSGTRRAVATPRHREALERLLVEGRITREEFERLAS